MPFRAPLENLKGPESPNVARNLLIGVFPGMRSWLPGGGGCQGVGPGLGTWAHLFWGGVVVSSNVFPAFGQLTLENVLGNTEHRLP